MSNKTESKVQEITVTRALSELKSLQDRITAAVQRPFIALTLGQGDNTKMYKDARDVDAVRAELVSNFDSASGLIQRRHALKRAVMASNAVTRVTVDGREMTVAEAIERKQSIGYARALLQSMIEQRRLRTSEHAAIEQKLTEEIRHMAEVMNSRESADATKQNNIKAVNDQQRRVSEPALLDPNQLDEKIKNMEEHIQAFLGEIDFVLSESNAITRIKVEA